MRNSAISLLLVALLCGIAVAQEPPAEAESKERAAKTEKLSLLLDQRIAEIREWEELRERYQGDDRLAVERELVEKKIEALDDLHELAEAIVEQEETGGDASAVRGKVMPLMEEVTTVLKERFEESLQHGSDLRSTRAETAPEELLDLELEISRADERIRMLAGRYRDQLRASESLGLDVAADREWFATTIERLAKVLISRIEITLARGKEVDKQLSETPDDVALLAENRALDRRFDGGTVGLKSIVEIMQELELDTSEEQQLLVRTTGSLADLDSEVALSLVGRSVDNAKAWFSENGPLIAGKILMFLAILLAFRFLAGIIQRLVVRAMGSSKVHTSKLLENMITSMVRRAVMILGLLVALSQVGVSVGPVLAGLGVAGFVIGFALQDTLSNFAAGIMILFYRPFDVDDLVEAGGVFGTVSKMTLVSTTILTIDNQTLVVPNSKIWGDVIKNVTAQTQRRVDMTFGISYTDDIPKAEKVLHEILVAHPKVLAEPEPTVKLHNLGESSVDFVVRPWVDTDDYWDVYWDVTREVKMRFDREGISIPFPQRDVHVYQETPATA